MSLSSLIVEREIATIRDVEEALARQVLYGGDLVTNLFEVCRVDEAALNTLVADTFGLPPAPAGELPHPSAEAKKALASEVARERSLVPLSIDQYGLVVAVAEPLSREVEQELSFALALPISQHVAPLVRIKQAIARDYGVALERRMQRVLGKLDGTIPRNASMRPPPVMSAEPPRPPSLRSSGVARTAEEPEPRRPVIQGTLVRDVEAPPPRPVRRRRGPLTVDLARAELEEAEERDAIFDVVFEFARQYFDYAALFLVRDDMAEGRDAFGEGAPRDRVARIVVPLDAPSMLAAAREKRAIARGTPARDGIDAMLGADLSRPQGTEQVVFPVVVRTRVVALLVGDAGRAGVDDASLADVQGIVGSAAAAFERLVVRRKLKSTAPPPLRPSQEPAPPTEVSPEEPAPPTNASPEEPAPPILELLAEPPSAVAQTTRQPEEAVKAAARDVRPPSERPPPAHLLEVRRPSGRPIPREEPGSFGPIHVDPPVPIRRAEAPPLEFGGAVGEHAFAEDDVEKKLLDQIHGREEGAPTTRRDAKPPVIDPPLSPKAASDPPPPPPRARTTDVSPGALPMLPSRDPEPEPTPVAPPAFEDADLTPYAPPVAPVFEKQMPPSEQAVSVGAHKPPSSRTDLRVLPSVIVDVSSEYVAFVDRVIAGHDDEAEGDLLRAGGYAMPAIMAKFPGPIAIDPAKIEAGLVPRASDCGPVLRLVSSQRRTALPFVLSFVEDANVDRRFWATYLLTDLVYPDAIEPVVKRIFDREPRVRRAARAAIRAMAEAHPSAVVDRLEAIARSPEASISRRGRATQALGDTREALAVPAAIRLLDATPLELANAARASLVTLTRHDLGTGADKWLAWWSSNEGRHRIEWLVDALGGEDERLRAAAADELKALTREHFGFSEELPKRERERVQAKYREWWQTTGRVRLSRRP